MNQVLGDLRHREKLARETMLGFPLDLSGELNVDPITPFLRRSRILNNLGDPFVGGTYALNTFEMEREAVRWFARLFQLQSEPWGYVTNSGSEGNLAGIAAGVLRHSDPMVYASEKAHYSVDKACRLMHCPLVKMSCLADHSVGVDALVRHIERHVTGESLTIVLTAGTTMSGAVDDIALVRDRFPKAYIHVDAALSGLLLPFLPGVPPFDFATGIDSISVSGHKMLGIPVPCGVFVSRHQPASPSVDYVGSRDATIGGSRSGWAALAVWHAIQHFSAENYWDHSPKAITRFTARARRCVERAEDAEQALKEISWPCWRNPDCNTVVIKRPPDTLVRKWQLAADGDEAHIITMPHVTGDMLRTFVSDLSAVS